MFSYSSCHIVNLLWHFSSLFGQHDINELAKVTSVWLQGCQKALQDLHASLAVVNSSGEEITIDKLLEHLNIDTELVKYSKDDDSFHS